MKIFNNFKILVSFLAISLLAFSAWAYIPKTRMILSRAIKNSGSQTYQVIQEVHFKTETDALVVKELWTVIDGKTLRLKATGGTTLSDQWEFNAIYKDGRRFVFEGDDKVHNYPQSVEFAEPYFHFRKLDNLLYQLIRIDVLPNTILKPNQPAYSLNQVKYEPEPYARLSRVSGYIAYAFGQPTPAGSDVSLPGVWVEQDSFLLRKLRFKSQAEVQANKYQSYNSGLKLPKDRTITWNNNAVFIRTISAKSLGSRSSLQSRFQPNTLLSLKKTISSDRREPRNALIKEFYARFR